MKVTQSFFLGHAGLLVSTMIAALFEVNRRTPDHKDRRFGVYQLITKGINHEVQRDKCTKNVCVGHS